MDEDVSIASDINFDTEEDLDNIEAAGLKSKFRELQKACNALHKQTVQLKMAKAPLEARMRQNEDNWRKEKSKYTLEIDALKVSE